MMKCFLWDFKSNDLENVRKHYLDFHNVDRNNHFFKKLFKKQNKSFSWKKCVRCDEFLPNSRYEVIPDFLVHYEAGKGVFEEKPLTYTTFGERNYFFRKFT